MIPLWITATDPSADTCGCALESVGPPWVAHRVCPMPSVEGGSPSSASTFSRLASLPAFLAVLSRPSARTATPAESYPRYSSRRSPSRTTSNESCGPTYPTMPHISRTIPGKSGPTADPERHSVPRGVPFATSGRGGDDLCQPRGDRVGLLLGGGLDHHADELLGAGGAQQRPAGVAELGFALVERRGDLIALRRGETVG